MTCRARNRLLALAALCLAGALSPSSVPAAEALAQREVLDLSEAAALLRVKPAAVRSLAQANGIPARRVGGEWRFTRTALLEWLAGGPFGAAPGASAPQPVPLVLAQSLAEPPRARARAVAPPDALRIAQAAVQGAAAPGAAPTPTLGERPAAPSAEDIALRDQRVLLRRGATTVDVGLAYTRGEQTLIPVVRQEQRALAASAALRYGLRDELQLTARLPALWRRSTTHADASVGGTTSPAVTRGRFTGDASVSLLGVAMHEAVGRPNLLWSLDAVLPTGPGDRGLGGGLVLSRSYDPAVVFAGLSYLHGLAVDPADSRRALARHNLGLNLGYTYALNDSLALNTLFVGSYRNARSADGVSIPPASERYQLQFGMTWMLAPGLFIEPAVAMRVGAANPDVSFSLNLPYSF